jgi:hypothetical protein
MSRQSLKEHAVPVVYTHTFSATAAGQYSELASAGEKRRGERNEDVGQIALDGCGGYGMRVTFQRFWHKLALMMSFCRAM